MKKGSKHRTQSKSLLIDSNQVRSYRYPPFPSYRFDSDGWRYTTETLTRTYQFSNPGQEPAVIGAINLSSTQNGIFTFDASDCVGETLLQGESCDVDVTFAPVQVTAPGNYPTTLSGKFEADAADNLQEDGSSGGLPIRNSRGPSITEPAIRGRF